MSPRKRPLKEIVNVRRHPPEAAVMPSSFDLAYEEDPDLLHALVDAELEAIAQRPLVADVQCEALSEAANALFSFVPESEKPAASSELACILATARVMVNEYHDVVAMLESWKAYVPSSVLAGRVGAAVAKERSEKLRSERDPTLWAEIESIRKDDSGLSVMRVAKEVSKRHPGEFGYSVSNLMKTIKRFYPR